MQLDYARKLVDLIERMSETEESDAQAIDQYHELLVELGVLGAIGNVGLNIVCGEMPQIQAKLFERAIASEVQRRTNAVFQEFEERLGAIELSAPAAASANDVPSQVAGVEWMSLTPEYRQAVAFPSDDKSHAFQVLGVEGEHSMMSICGVARGDMKNWKLANAGSVLNPCESCVKGVFGHG